MLLLMMAYGAALPRGAVALRFAARRSGVARRCVADDASAAAAAPAFEALAARGVERARGETARLVVVPVPLGEVSDVTFRAAATLAAADVVACEDTRKTGLFLSALGVDRSGGRPRLARHDVVTANATAPRLVAAMRGGETVALVSDAGTPAISDPGVLLVDAAHRAGLAVTALPGPCAATTALSCCGFDTSGGFRFHGFVEGRGASAKRSRSLAAALNSVGINPGISSTPSTSLKSNSFSMILEALILASRVLDD